MRKSMGEVEKEWLGLIRDDEVLRFLRVAAGELRLIGLGVDEFVAAEERGIPPSRFLINEGASLSGITRRGVHVVGVRQTEVKIKAVLQRMVRGVVRPNSQVPLANHARGVALSLERLSNGDFRGGQAACRDTAEDPKLVMGHPAADRVATREDGGATGRADFGGNVELGEAGALGGHPVEVRRTNRRVAVTAEISIPEVIGEDNHNIGLSGGRPCRKKRAEQGQASKGEDSHGVSKAGYPEDAKPFWAAPGETACY